MTKQSLPLLPPTSLPPLFLTSLPSSPDFSPSSFRHFPSLLLLFLSPLPNKYTSPPHPPLPPLPPRPVGHPSIPISGGSSLSNANNGFSNNHCPQLCIAVYVLGVLGRPGENLHGPGECVTTDTRTPTRMCEKQTTPRVSGPTSGLARWHLGPGFHIKRSFPCPRRSSPSLPHLTRYPTA